MAAAPPADCDNSNVNYGPKDGYDGTLTERAQIINGGSITFDPLRSETFFCRFLVI